MSRTDGAHGALAALPADVRQAVAAARDKLAVDIVVLDLRKADAFTDYFVICSGLNTRQTRTIADAIEEALRRRQVRTQHLEGYNRGDWVLLDFFDFVVHIFTRETRAFYALERLWGRAEEIAITADERGTSPRG